MKSGLTKLFSSPKFWAINWGILVGCTLYYLLGDGSGLGSEFPMLVVGSYTTIGALGAGRDIAKAIKGAEDEDNTRQDNRRRRTNRGRVLPRRRR